MPYRTLKFSYILISWNCQLCANHGYMGGESNLEFDQTCDLGDSISTPSTTNTQTKTPVVAVECCDGTNMTFDVQQMDAEIKIK